MEQAQAAAVAALPKVAEKLLRHLKNAMYAAELATAATNELLSVLKEARDAKDGGA